MKEESIAKSAVHTIRGYETQFYVTLLAWFEIFILEGDYFDSIFVEGLEDIHLVGRNRKLFVQVKKKERIGHWKPNEILSTLTSMFIRWSNSLYDFEQSRGNDFFILVVGGDISSSIFGKNEDTSKAITTIEQMFKIPQTTTLKDTSKIKNSLKTILREQEQNVGYEPRHLNYFIRNLRICPNLPNLEELKKIVHQSALDIISLYSTGITPKTIEKISNKALDIIREGSSSKTQVHHSIKYNVIRQTVVETLNEELGDYIIRFDRYKSEGVETVMERKLASIKDSKQIIETAIHLKNKFLRKLSREKVIVLDLKHLYEDFIDFWRIKQGDFNDYTSIIELFIAENPDIFKNLQKFRNIETLQGVFFDLISYCTFDFRG